MPRARRDTVTYALYNGRKKVYIGSTSDPKRRVQQHLEEGKRFTRVEVTSYRMTEDSAKRREGEQLASYKRNHSGKKPRYNKTDHG